MKKFIPILLAAVCVLAHAQTPVTAISGRAWDQYGQVVPFAQVRVCLATSVGLPCTPTTPIYRDYGLTQSISNPTAADQYGNYTLYVPQAAYPNLYVVQQSANGGLTWTYVYNGPSLQCQFSGCLAGAGTKGFLPLWSGSLALENSLADYGVTEAGYFTFPAPVNVSAPINLQAAYGNTVNPPTTPWTPSSYQQSIAQGELGTWNGPTPTYTDPYPVNMQSVNIDSFTRPGFVFGAAPSGFPAGGLTTVGHNWTLYNHSQGTLLNYDVYVQSGLGDFSDLYLLLTSYGGIIAPDDEGPHRFAGGVSHPATDFEGTVTTGGTGATTLSVNCTQSCGLDAISNNITSVGDGRPILDISAPIATATVTGYTPASSWTPEVYTVTVNSGNVVPSTGIGTLNAYCGPGTSQHLAGTQTTPVSCAVTVTTGSFSAGQTITFSGNRNEVETVTSVTPLSGGVQTITFPVRYGHASGSNVYQGGNLVGSYMVATANMGGTGNAMRFPVAVLGALSSTRILVAAFYANILLGTSYSGPFANGGSQAITIYPGAEMLDAQNASNGYVIDGNNMSIGVNSAPWAGGDTVEETMMNTWSLDEDRVDINQSEPCVVQSGGSCSWWGYAVNRAGNGVAMTPGSLTAENTDEAHADFLALDVTPYSLYAGSGNAGTYNMAGGVGLQLLGPHVGGLVMRDAPTPANYDPSASFAPGAIEYVGPPAINPTNPVYYYDLSMLRNYNNSAWNEITYTPLTNVLNHLGPETFQGAANTYNGTTLTISGASNIGLTAIGPLTNLVTYSGQYTQFSGSNGWTVSDGPAWTLTANTTDVTAPDGTSTATKAVYVSSSGQFYNENSADPIQANTTYTTCAYIRTLTGTATVGLGNIGGSGFQNVWTITDTWPAVPYSLTYTTGGSLPRPEITSGFNTQGNSGTIYLAGNWTVLGTSCGGYLPTGSSAVPTPSAYIAGGNAAFPTLTLAGGHVFTRHTILTASLTPGAVTASTCAVQSLSVTGALTGDFVTAIIPPSALSHVSISGGAIAGSGTIGINFCGDSTGGTPPSGTWSFDVEQ